MSSGDSDAGPQKRKRSRQSPEDSASTSSGGSPIIGSSLRPRRRPLVERNPNLDSSDSESDSGSLIRRYNKRKKNMRLTSGTDSDNSDSIIFKRPKRTGRIPSESDLSDSSSIIFKRSRVRGRIPSESDVDSDVSDRGFEGSTSSQWETDCSDTESAKVKPETSATTVAPDTNIDSDSSDGQSEKCPICLMSFKTQEIGTPESCDHLFCLECIQEWSKNVNTCPVDRQEYGLILVRKSIEGKVVKQIPIERPVPQNDVDILEDPTFCEICHSSNNEDRMLLCDGCDLGFHLDCLNPPLSDVPAGAWYCNDCSPDDEYNSEIEMYEIQLLLDEAEMMDRPQGRRRIHLPRLVPRTRHSERVRRRIANNRQQNHNQPERPTTSSSTEGVQRVSSSTSRPKRSRKPKKKSTRRYKIVYEIDPATGETVPVKKRQKKAKKKSKKSSRRVREVARPRTVKKRLAAQLRICAPRSVPQSLPDVRSDTAATNTLGGMRYQAGIPTLHLFGQNHQLDYFSDGGEEDGYFESGSLLIGRTPNRSDVSAMRRAARRKAVIAPSTVTSSTDLLGSILSSQELFHSKNASYRVDSSGKFKIENKKSHNDYVDVNKEKAVGKQRPNSYQNQGGGDPGYSSGGYHHSHNLNQYHSTPTSTMESSDNACYGGGGVSSGQNETPQDYTQRTLCASYDPSPQERRDDDNTGTNTPNSESEIDIYSDIETVSTSKVDDGDMRPPSPPRISNCTPNMGTDDENNDSEPDMVIDDEKVQEADKSLEYNIEEAAVTSTVSFNSEYVSPTAPDNAHSSTEIQSGAVQSSDSANKVIDYDEDSTDGCPNTSIYSKQSIEAVNEAEDVDSDDGCPNFSIYSKESKSVALHTDISLSAEDNPGPIHQDYQVGEISSSPIIDMPRSPEIPVLENAQVLPTIPAARATLVDKFTNPAPTDLDASDAIGYAPVGKLSQNGEPFKSLVKGGILGGLYSDSEDEAVVKKGGTSFDLSDINHMTEDISEEERSYTPCLDERGHRQGLEGLDTELISDEERNDFDESHELKTASDGDALEINAKESELDFTRPEDYEEGEIVDKNKAAKKKEEDENEDDKKNSKPKNDEELKKPKKKEKEKVATEAEKEGNKENEGHIKESSFKKLSKNTKERNYRDKDKESDHQLGSESSREDKREKGKREKRKELERYNVRALIADKPRPLIIKDQFGRDIRRTPTRSRSRSYTPPIQASPARARKSPSPIRRSPTPKPQRSLSRHRSLSRNQKERSPSKERSRKRRVSTRHRSVSRSRSPRKKRPVSKSKKEKRRSISRYGKRRKGSGDRYKSKKKARPRRSRSRTPTRKREWNRAGWTPVSMSPSPEDRHVSPSWTPPRLIEASQDLRNQNFTVVVDNSKKKKDKRRRGEKRGKEGGEPRPKKRRRERERTPPPSKEVFASGDNILVSVSFNNENETRDVTTRDRRKKDANGDSAKKNRERKQQSKNKRDLSGVKPVAIIDLERSPFKELTPSPKDVIVLSDSDNNDNEPGNGRIVQNICDSSEQVGSPERSVNYSTGPKTPPEPQIKFSLNAKPPQVRAISNPLHEPDDMENQDEAQDEINQRMNDSLQLHKGPNTPPEPPNSPPSSPDAYDPFEPTKSRSPTPEPMEAGQLNSSLNIEDKNVIDSRSAIDLLEKSTNPSRDIPVSLTPPIADIQPADSQSSIQVTPELNLGKGSPERIGVLINQTVVPPSLSTSKPVAQTTPFSSVSTSMITSTPVSSNLAPSRINILNSTILAPLHQASSIPQRIVLPNQIKSSPVKISPTKTAIKSTPIKPMPNKASKSGSRKSRTQNGSSNDDLNIDFDSPYSPGSSDYEDLFEPPPDNVIKSTSKSVSKSTSKTPQKSHQSVFDALFGSPNFSINKNKGKNDKSKFGKKPMSSGKTKTVGVKLDEDNLKILDDLPNSAVEMQVKDKFLKKLNRQERVVEEVKLVLKPHYNKKRISKEEYKDILRRAVPKICHNKSGEINPTKIKNLIEAYIKKVRHSKKVTSSSSVNPQKV